MRFFTTSDSLLGFVMFQYVAAPFHSQKLECDERVRGKRRELGGR